MGVSGAVNGIQPFAELAQSATTVVYKGYERARGRFVLLKVLQPVVAEDAAFIERLEAEARLLSKIHHPNVVTIFEFGRDDGTVYLTAEFVEGINLAELCARGPVPVELAVYILREAARGLQAAHEQGILHRDVKPANILVSFEGIVKVADFGMASIALDEESTVPPGEVRGTLAYLAPEQILGEPPGVAADIFSLGATFFEMLTGQPAFSGASAPGFFEAVLNHDPVPFLAAVRDLPEQAVEVCRKMLAKSPEERYAGVGELLDDLAPLSVRAPAAAEDLSAYLSDAAAYESRVRINPEPDLPPEPSAAIVETRKGAPGYRRFIMATIGFVLMVGGGYALVNRFSGLAAGVDSAADRGERVVPNRGDSGATVVDIPIAMNDVEAVASDSSRAGLPPVRSDPDPPSADVAPGLNQPSEAGSAVARERLPRSGTIRVVSEPWSVVYINGDSVGVTPFGTTSTQALDAGEYEITLQPIMPDFPAYRTTIEIEPGKARDLNVSLWEAVGRITFQVNPWAYVTIDGIYRDDTPLSLILAPGAHNLVLVHPQFGRFEDTITVAAGAIDTLRYNLVAMRN